MGPVRSREIRLGQGKRKARQFRPAAAGLWSRVARRLDTAGLKTMMATVARLAKTAGNGTHAQELASIGDVRRSDDARGCPTMDRTPNCALARDPQLSPVQV